MNDRQIPRAEGQVWIEKENPFNMKYYVGGKTYVLSPTATYTYEDTGSEAGSKILYAGTVVKFNKANNITKAVFPDDLEGVLGVTTADLVKGTGVNLPITVAQTGYVTISTPNQVFATTADYTLGEGGNSFSKTSIIGKPVYWFIGRINKTDSGYEYITAADKAGKLTLATPCGFIKDVDSVNDDSLNISYDNLPQIGSVAAIKTAGNTNTITEVIIHLNFSKFDSSLEWSWPRVHDSNSVDCGKVTCNISEGEVVPVKLSLRHGLFPSHSELEYKARNFTEVTASPLDNLNKEFNIQTDIDNNYDPATINSVASTVVTIKSPTPMLYRISGRVNYKFDKNHASKTTV